MRELYELEKGTHFKVDSERHLEYIKSLMGDRFDFYSDSGYKCLLDEPYLYVEYDYGLVSVDSPLSGYEQVIMPIPDDWAVDVKHAYAKVNIENNTGLGVNVTENGEDINVRVLSEKLTQDMVKKPNHYQLLPEYEVKDVNKALLDKIEESDFSMTLYEAGWYQQAMQYFMRFYAKNGLEDLEKGVQTMQFAIDSIEQREDNQ